MNLRKLLLTNNACYKAGKFITIKGIMVHSTGANNPNLSRYIGTDDGLLGPNKYGNHWNQDKPDGRNVCVHAFIGKLTDSSIATYQTLPWNMRGWHCASGSKGSGNNTHISFEICEDGLTDTLYFSKIYQEAVELCAYLCKTFSLDPLADGVLICHSEGHKRGIASNHADIMHWFPKHGKNMDSFRAAVKAAMDAPDTSAGDESSESSGNLYRVQVGAYANKANADATAKKLKVKDYDTYIVSADGLYKVQIGAYANKANADAMAAKVKDDGLDAYITTKGGTAVDSSISPITIGSKVKVKSGAKTYTGGGLASFVYDTVYDVIQINGDYVVIGLGKAVTTAMNIADLALDPK